MLSLGSKDNKTIAIKIFAYWKTEQEIKWKQKYQIIKKENKKKLLILWETNISSKLKMKLMKPSGRDKLLKCGEKQ